MKLTKGLIKADIIAAKQSIEFFEAGGVKDIKNIAAYHLQQATEKLIKYQIYNSGVEFDASQMYTHNIERLILYGESLGVALNVPAYIREKSLRITDWEAGSRYDVSFAVRIDILKKTYSVIEAWYSSI